MQMGLFSGSLCFPVFQDPQVCCRCSVLKQHLRWMEGVCLQFSLSVRTIMHIHAASHQWHIWFSISLSTVTYHTFHKKMQETSNGCLDMICPWGNFLFSQLICQAIYLQTYTSFVGCLALVHLCDTFLTILIFNVYLNPCYIFLQGKSFQW